MKNQGGMFQVNQTPTKSPNLFENATPIRKSMPVQDGKVEDVNNVVVRKQKEEKENNNNNFQSLQDDDYFKMPAAFFAQQPQATTLPNQVVYQQ